MDPSAHDALKLEEPAGTPAVVIRSAGVKIEASPPCSNRASHRCNVRTVTHTALPSGHATSLLAARRSNAVRAPRGAVVASAIRR